MESLSVTEIMAIRDSCDKGYSKEEAADHLTEAETELERFREENKDVLSRLAELENERLKWRIYIQEYQYAVGRCYEYRFRDVTVYMRVASCGSGRYFRGRAVVLDSSSYRRIDSFEMRVWDMDNLREISQESFEELWNKAEYEVIETI